MGWHLYDRLIEGIPEGVLVRDYALGLSWSYVEAESAMGVAYTCRGGARKATEERDLHGRPLREMAQLAKSWHYEEAIKSFKSTNHHYKTCNSSNNA